MISEKATSYLSQCSKILQSELSNQYNVVDEISINLKDIHELRDILNELSYNQFISIIFPDEKNGDIYCSFYITLQGYEFINNKC